MKKARRRKPGLVVLAWWALTAEVVLALFTSPYLAPRRIVIADVRPEDQSRVAQIMAAWKRLPLTSLRRSVVEREIRADPRMAGATLRYGFPYELRVGVSYRQPRAIVTDGRRAFYSDAGLVPYEEVPWWTPEEPTIVKQVCELAAVPASAPGEPTQMRPPASPVTLRYVVPSLQAQALSGQTGLPVIQTATPLVVRLGHPSRDNYVRVAYETLAQMDGKNFPRAAQIAVDSKGNMCLNMSGVPTVRLGNSEQIVAKIAKLNEMLLRSPSLTDNVEYFDFSYPAVPVRKLASGSAASE